MNALSSRRVHNLLRGILWRGLDGRYKLPYEKAFTVVIETRAGEGKGYHPMKETHYKNTFIDNVSYTFLDAKGKEKTIFLEATPGMGHYAYIALHTLPALEVPGIETFVFEELPEKK